MLKILIGEKYIYVHGSKGGVTEKELEKLNFVWSLQTFLKKSCDKSRKIAGVGEQHCMESNLECVKVL